MKDAQNQGIPPTEQSGRWRDLERQSVADLVGAMNGTWADVGKAMDSALPAITELIELLVPRMKKGGRLFYIGAGTSGRLGVVDASECPPTFGVAPGRVVGLIAGGDGALRNAVEGAEDDASGAWRDLAEYGPNEKDTLVGIAASGRTPYVVGGIKKAREAGMLTAALVCNPGSAAAQTAEVAIELISGPEFVTGSTRLKAGTVTKLALNMITTATMIRLGHVKGTEMVDMHLSNVKLVERGTRMVCEATGTSEAVAREALLSEGSVRAAVALLETKRGHAHD